MNEKEKLNLIRASLERQLRSCAKIIGHIESLFELSCFKVKSAQKDAKYSHITMKAFAIRSAIKDTLERVNKETVDIAVVGREKAGKSTLLNALIGCEILPSDKNRCTYTITEIQSCVKKTDQRYEIHYFSKDEFDKKYSETRRQLESARKSIDKSLINLLTKEVEEIEQYKFDISKYCGQKPEIKPFERLYDVKDELFEVISKPQRARAVQKVIIYTNTFTSIEGLVLCDVPGYDSPITLHKEQTKKKIATADAIIYAKEFEKPDLNDTEIEILKITDEVDPNEEIGNKIVVALTKCDIARSKPDFDDTLNKAYLAWTKENVRTESIIPCSPGCIEVTLEGENIKERLKALEIDDGIDNIKKAVSELAYSTRTQCLQRKTGNILTDTRRLAENFVDFVTKDCSIDYVSPLSEKIREEFYFKVNEWWPSEWRRIEENFSTFYNQYIVRDCPLHQEVDTLMFTQNNTDELEPNDFQEIKDSIDPRDKKKSDLKKTLTDKVFKDITYFKQEYDRAIDAHFDNLPSITIERQNSIIASHAHENGFLPIRETNTDIRKELTDEAIEAMNKISGSFVAFLVKMINVMIEWVSIELWDIPEVRPIMFEGEEGLYLRFLKYCFDSLFRRLTMPAIELFLRFPRSKNERLPMMHEYQMELIQLDNFYISGLIQKRGIITFLANGTRSNFQIEIAYNQSMSLKSELEREREATAEAERKKNGKSRFLRPVASRRTDTIQSTRSQTRLSPSRSSLPALQSQSGTVQQSQIQLVSSQQTQVSTSSTQPATPSQQVQTSTTETLSSSSETSVSVTGRYLSSEQFGKLTFSTGPNDANELRAEIASDFNEFKACLKNSIYYGSSILRFMQQELSVFKKRFIDLERKKRKWHAYVVLELQRGNIRSIPAPAKYDSIECHEKIKYAINAVNKILENLI